MIANEALSMRDEYRDKHHVCVYCEIVPKQCYLHCRNEGVELEHLFQNLGGKLDDPCNYVVCCRVSHEWKHKFSILGRISALYWKWKHGEFDRQKLFDLVGMDPVGWIENRREDGHLPEWTLALVDEILKAHSE